MSEYVWLLVVMLGPVLLGGAILYAIIRQRRLRPDEARCSDAATRELYEDDENADTRHLGGRNSPCNGRSQVKVPSAGL
jgi:hypothetical protein